MDKERRRAQRDRVLRERRGINEEQVPLFALGRKDSILPDMDTGASKMATKRQTLEKIRKTKRHEILTEKRNMETLMESHSAASAALQRAIKISLKKIGDLVPEIRRRNKDAILSKRRTISAELELEEVLQETSRHVTFSRSESLETPNLQRAAAQKMIRNSRDWVVQCSLIYAKPIINGNGALQRSRTSAENISIPENKQLSDSPPNTSPDKEEPDGMDKMYHDTSDILAQGLEDSSVQISPQGELVHTDQTMDFYSLEFLKDLGKGNYGKVSLASDPVSEGLLAIKIMDKSSCEDIIDIISTELEVLRLAAGCPYLMSMRAFMETQTEYSIAMDYMAGGDLLHHMKDSMLFNTKTIRLFAAEMVCGLQFLHEHGVIHSDLKPENILLQDTGHIKICDFGLSAMNVSEGDLVWYIVGTKGYIAPEIMDDEGYNHLADSFSFGVILYMMSVGDWPFYSQGTTDEYHQSLREHIPYFPPGICNNTMAIINGLLCKTASARLAITSSIRSHPFFHSIDWSDVDCGRSDPPFPYYYQEY
ncbi:protein kinase C delta type-like isoform X2 [Ranitomeya variabilis]|uniref:protein kinase C delta type-like isoform X2 n=1 Tax=Ranitomeya variabilis TaxID=490064 RepID=UPI004055AF6B